MMLHCAGHNDIVWASSAYMLQDTLQKLFMYSGFFLRGGLNEEREKLTVKTEKESLTIT